MARFYTLILILLMAGACQQKTQTLAPPRETSIADVPLAVSRIVVPVSVDLDQLAARLNKDIPTTLYTHDSIEKACVPAAKLTMCLKHERPCKGDACKDVPCKVGFKNAKVTPSLSCRIVAEVTRGPISLSGKANNLHIQMPVYARANVRDVGKILSETATAQAHASAVARLALTPDWKPTAKVEIDYSWTKKPGFEVMGKRVTFAGKADPQIQKIITQLEHDLPRHIQDMRPKTHLEMLWQKAFTTVELNSKNPPVWMRVTPTGVGYGGYHVRGNELVLDLELEANVETFVGDKPEPRPATPLPNATTSKTPTGFRIVAPVVADYKQLQPVLSKALEKLGEKPFSVPAIGMIKAEFGEPKIYATTGGKLALGLPITAKSLREGATAKGYVWLTGEPYNLENSPIIKVRNLKITGKSDRVATDLLLAVAESPAVSTQIEAALSQNFNRDLTKLRSKIDKALENKRVDDFVLNVTISDLRYGVIKALGQGAYLPVEMEGEAKVEWKPLAKPK